MRIFELFKEAMESVLHIGDNQDMIQAKLSEVLEEIKKQNGSLNSLIEEFSRFLNIKAEKEIVEQAETRERKESTKHDYLF